MPDRTRLDCDVDLFSVWEHDRHNTHSHPEWPTLPDSGCIRFENSKDAAAGEICGVRGPTARLPESS
ncbi:MAG: hypothetical protein ACR2NM_06640 [Bythopirellula sp.]